MDHINDKDLDGYERFGGGGNWSTMPVFPKSVVDLLSKWESENLREARSSYE